VTDEPAVLIVVSGLPGAGKTTVAGAYVRAIHALSLKTEPPG